MKGSDMVLLREEEQEKVGFVMISLGKQETEDVGW